MIYVDPNEITKRQEHQKHFGFCLLIGRLWTMFASVWELLSNTKVDLQTQRKDREITRDSTGGGQQSQNGIKASSQHIVLNFLRSFFFFNVSKSGNLHKNVT